MKQYSSTGVGLYVASERHFVRAAKATKANGTARGVLYFPALNQSAADIQTDFIIPSLLRAGFIVCAFDMGNPAGSAPLYANDTVMTRASSAFTYLTTTLGAKSDKVLVWGGSAGGLGALNWAQRNPSLVSAIGVSIPLMDIPYVHDDTPAQTANIEAAYGGASWATNCVGHSPSGFAASMSAVKTKIWYASGDTDPWTATHFYTDYGAAAGANTVLRSLGAVGHDYLQTSADEVVEFFNTYR